MCVILGYTGAQCEVNVNECLSQPCQNNGTCEDVVVGYTCHCASGWQGEDCHESIDDCKSSPCLNGATCIDLHEGYANNKIYFRLETTSFVIQNVF